MLCSCDGEVRGAAVRHAGLDESSVPEGRVDVVHCEDEGLRLVKTNMGRVFKSGMALHTRSFQQSQIRGTWGFECSWWVKLEESGYSILLIARTVFFHASFPSGCRTAIRIFIAATVIYASRLQVLIQHRRCKPRICSKEL